MKGVVIKSKRGTVVKRFDKVKEAAVYFHVTQSAMTWRLAKGFVDENGNSVCYEDNEVGIKPKSIKAKTARRKKESIEQEPVLERKKYRIIPYEVKNIRVCVTKCPHKPCSDVFVGSGQCCMCRFFKGRDRTTHEVACSYSGKSLI